MIKRLKSNFIFYFKTLFVYGLLFAFFYCPAMQYEQKYDEKSVELSTGTAILSVDNVKNSSGPALYPYAKIINIIEQCRDIEREVYTSGTVNFGSLSNNDLVKVKKFYEKANVLFGKLEEEERCFDDYIAGTCFKRRGERIEKIRFECDKGRCQYQVKDKSVFSSDEEALSGKRRNKKTRRYTSLVLKRCKQKLDHLRKSSQALIKKINEEDRLAQQSAVARAISETSDAMPVV